MYIIILCTCTCTYMYVQYLAILCLHYPIGAPQTKSRAEGSDFDMMEEILQPFIVRQTTRHTLHEQSLTCTYVHVHCTYM